MKRTLHLVMTEIGKSIDKAIEYLLNDEVIGIPTETVYGLAGNALKPEVVVKIFEIKNRPHFNPLIVHTYSFEKSWDYVETWDARLIKLAEAFSPGPITFLLPKKKIIPDLVTAGSSKVAIRIPNQVLTLEILRNLQFPLAAPSANPFGYVSPTTAEHVWNNLKGKIPYILDGGPCTIGLESTIVGVENEHLVVYRLGGITLEDMEKIVGKINKVHLSSSKPQAPGMLLQHYAPQKKIWVTNDLKKFLTLHSYDNLGVIFYGEVLGSFKYSLNLSNNQSLTEAAQNFFNALRAIENWNVDYVVIQWFEERGLGRALNDKLKRAALKIVNY